MKNTAEQRNQQIAETVKATLPNGGSYARWSLARDLLLQYYGDMLATMKANALQNSGLLD